MTAMLLDAASMYFRAYHALPTSITASDGSPVNAVRGFLDMLAVLVKRSRPSQLVACLDQDWRPAWRVELIPSYKAQRVDAARPEQEAAPDALGPQVPILLEVLAALGVPAIGAPNYEADDVIGTLAFRLAAEHTVEVVTGDRDLFSLIRASTGSSKAITVLYIARGIANLAEMDPTELQQRYGVSPEQYADVAVLRGDSSDGLPGVRGIGEKTATRLITTFGSLTQLQAAVKSGDDRISARLTASIAEHGDYLAAARRVVTICTEVPIQTPNIATPLAPPNAARLAELAQCYNLGSSITRVSTALYAR
ncbi:MAG: flap endonuclease [Acidimicrobiales bacterium]|nr:MAG: flap endonuclease [Acidimicrobiales bacterium]